MKLLRILIPVVAIGLLQFVSCSSPQKHEVATHPLPASADTNVVLPPAWAFGVLYGAYTNQQQTIERIQKIEAHDYPIDAYWIDSWFWSFDNHGKGPKKYIDFVADTTAFPNRKAMWDFMQANNIKGGFWIWNCIQKTGNEAAFDEFEKKGYFSKVFINTDTWHNAGTTTAMFNTTKSKVATPTGNIDFDNPDAVAYFKQRMKHFFDEGADFIKLDRTSKISVCKAMFEMTQKFGKETEGRGFILSHSGGTGDPSFKRYPSKWTDDTRSDWTVEKPTKEFNPWVPRVAFKENIAMYTDPSKSTSKIPFLTNDLGGFDMGKTDKPDEELYIRWLQFSMFCPITEVFSQPENPTSNLAWLYSQRADTIFRFYSHLRMQLFPYLYSYANQSRLSGINMVRRIPAQLYEYMLGSELLVAPVHEKGATTQKIFLPEGKWINYWTGEQFQGNSEVTVAAPIYQIPLFIKQGSFIPMRKYASSIEKGNNNTLILHIYPGDNGRFNLLEDDGSSNDFLNGIYASTVMELKNSLNKFVVKINPVEGNYKGMSMSRKWILYLYCNETPKHIRMNRQELKFNYDKVKKIAIVETSQQSVKQLLDFEVSF